MDRMDVAMSELSIQQNIVFSRLEDIKDDMNICKNDIDVVKSQLALLERDIRMLEFSMGLAHNQLEDLGDRVNGFVESVWRVSSISETNSWSLGLEIQRVQQETCGHVESLFQKFEKVINIINKKIIHQDEEMDRVVDLVGQKIDTKMGEFSSNAVGEVLSSSSPDLDPVENMVVIPIPAPSIVHTLVEIPEEFIPQILCTSLSVLSTPSPPYVQVMEDDPAHDGTPKYWANPKAGVDH
jgi:hypothetical protein